MTETFVTLLRAWRSGELSLHEAADRAAKLAPAVRSHDPDGTVWFDGEMENTGIILQGFYPYEVVVEFLEAVAKAK